MKLFRTLLLAALLACAAPRFAAAQNNVALMPVPRMQFFNAAGQPLAGGYLYTCVAGSSCTAGTPGAPPSTPQATYTDSTGTVANQNPIVLDAGGFASIWLGPSAYKVIATDANGVQQWTQDNVRDLALLGTFSVSVSSYGAKGDGLTDDTASIAAACTAASGGTVQFVAGLTYKVISGAITTCQPGSVLAGNNATIDITSLNGYAFGVNIGGSALASSTPATIFQGFRVNGAAGSTAVVLRADNTPNVVMRDVTITNAQALILNGQSNSALIDNVNLTQTGSTPYGILIQQSTYSAPPAGTIIRHMTCTGVSTTYCVELQGGFLTFEDAVVTNAGVAVELNGSSVPVSVDVRNGVFNYSGAYLQRGVLMTSQPGAVYETTVKGANFSFNNTSGQAIAVDVNTANISLDFGSTVRQGVNTSNDVIRVAVASANLQISLTGADLINTTGSQTLNVFDLSGAGSLVYGAASANTLNSISGAINFVKPSPAGTFGAYLLAGNVFANCTNFLMSSGSVINSNMFFYSTGSTVTTPTMQLSGAALYQNYFTNNPASTISPKAANCGSNINYSCN